MNAAPRVVVMLFAGSAVLSPLFAVADDAAPSRGFFDNVLEMLDVKAKPADPPPDFVKKTRPDSSSLDFMQSSVPHKVSPIPTKSPGEVEAMKSALDAARAKQLTNTQPPVQIVQPKLVPHSKPPN